MNPGRCSSTKQTQEAGLCDCTLAIPVPTSANSSTVLPRAPSGPQESPGFPGGSDKSPVPGMCFLQVKDFGYWKTIIENEVSR